VKPARNKKLHPALKHAAFCATGILPGEDREAFAQLHQDVAKDFCPDGPVESDVVAGIARLLWRKKHLHTIRAAEAARERLAAIQSEKLLDVLVYTRSGLEPS
jgi:hypothetical protein